MVIYSYLSTSFDTIFDYLACSSWFIFLIFFSFVSCALFDVSIAHNLFQKTSGAKSAYYHGSSCFLLIYLCRNVFLFLFMLRRTAEWVWGKRIFFLNNFLTWQWIFESIPEISLPPCMRQKIIMSQVNKLAFFLLIAHCLVFSHNQPFRLGRGGDAHGRGGMHRGGEGGCTCILCIPPGYAPGSRLFILIQILIFYLFPDPGVKKAPDPGSATLLFG